MHGWFRDHPETNSIHMQNWGLPAMTFTFRAFLLHFPAVVVARSFTLSVLELVGFKMSVSALVVSTEPSGACL